jgi:hypothetical protein
VSVVTGYGLDGRGSIPGMGNRFFSTLSVQIGSGAHPATYSVGTEGSFGGGKAAGMVELYLHSPKRLQSW